MRVILVTVAVLSLTACAGRAPDAYQASCRNTSTAEIAALFDDWNAALQTGDPNKVVSLYAPDSVLLPTVKNAAHVSEADKLRYFEHFLDAGPRGAVDQRSIILDCNTAIDAGLYTFTFKDGSSVRARYSYTYRWSGDRWLITSHHSSLFPEGQ